MADARVRGRFVWYDLMTSHPAKAVEFYTKVTGWVRNSGQARSPTRCGRPAARRWAA